MLAKNEKLDFSFPSPLFRLFLLAGSSGQEYGKAQRALDQRGRLERLELSTEGAFAGVYSQYLSGSQKRGSLLVMRFVLLRPAYPRVPLSLLGLPRPVQVIFPMTVESVRGAFMPARKPSRFRSCFLKTDGPASVLPKTSTGGMALNLILIFHRSKLRKN